MEALGRKDLKLWIATTLCATSLKLTSIELVQPFQDYNEKYVRGTMKVFFYPTVNHEGVTYADAAHNVDDKKLLKDGSCIIMLDEPHPRRFVRLL